MFVKYPMNDENDIRGHVVLMFTNEYNLTIAYACVEELEPGMVELSPTLKQKVEEMIGRPMLHYRKHLCQAIDIMADSVRKSQRVGGQQTIDLEYTQVLRHFTHWNENGRQLLMPESVKIWVDVRADMGISEAQALLEIESAISEYESFLNQVRRLRVEGKASVLSAANQELATQAYEQAMANLKQLAVDLQPLLN